MIDALKMRQLNKIGTEKSKSGHDNFSIMKSLEESMLSNKDFEKASINLNDIENLQRFRKKLSGTQFGSFYSMFEEISLINNFYHSEKDRETHLQKYISESEKRSSHFSPRVADLYMGMLSKIRNVQYISSYPQIAEKLEELDESGDLQLLTSPDISWDMKLNRVETRLVDYLSGIRALDKRDGNEMDDDIKEWRQKELQKLSNNPPEKTNESKPGVDPMERLKEGEKSPSLWSINPAYGGYFKEQSFSKWDNKRNVWAKETGTYKDVAIIQPSAKNNIKERIPNLTMGAQITNGKWTTVPIPYTHGIYKAESNNGNCVVKQDNNGDVVVMAEGHDTIDVLFTLVPQPNKKITSKLENIEVPYMPSKFSEETNDVIQRIQQDKKGNIERAQALASYVRRRIKYLAPKNDEESAYYNNFYNTHKNGFASAVDEIKKADCDVANTYFAALCTNIDIPVRHCIGHMVKGKDEKDLSHITSGTGHGWSEVWDEIRKEWIRIDATPPGDNQLEESEEQENVLGDYGENEFITQTDEKLEELRKKLSKHKEKLSYTKEEREISESTGIDLREARKIIREIHHAERTTLPNGERITDILSQLFNNIVESLKNTSDAYAGPVRRREGGVAIRDIVRHKIGIVSGDSDPISRERQEEDIEDSKQFGGLDLYIIGDKSGSMQSVNDGKPLWDIQRRAEYLIFSALHRFERNLERAHLQGDNIRSIRTQGISFRGNKIDEIDFDKELSTTFSAKEKVNLWNSLSKDGTYNGDSRALNVIFNQIKDELSQIKNTGQKDNRIRVVIACSDGGYAGDELQMQALSRELHQLNTLVVGIGLAEDAKGVPIVMENPPVSHGDYVQDINDLPAVIAKYVILEAVKLFPKKLDANTERLTLKILEKFNYRK